MCGIAGIFELQGQGRPREERLEELDRAIALLAHRGPDEAGTFLDDTAALAVTRLAINDLPSGQQPMVDPSGRWVIAYNGEIYNHVELRAELAGRGHRFATRCDTEVALRAWIEWGEAAPERFEGGFAFVVLDRREHTAHLVRDRYGKRPLFFCRDGDAWLVASEIKAFLARSTVRLSWDPAGLGSIFTLWTPVGGEMPFAGVHQLPAGHLGRLSADGLSIRRWGGFPLPREVTPPPPTAEAAGKRARELLEHAVGLRLRSDVEVGVLLSGGLDSTLVSILAQRRQGERMRAFSVAFSDPAFDEFAEQRLVAEAFGFAHHVVTVTPESLVAGFSEALWHAEIPQFRTAFVPMMLLAELVRQHGIKVVLSGEGADETFLGYNLFKETRLRAAWRTLPAEERHARLSRLYPYLPHFSGPGARALEGRYARSAEGVDEPLFSHVLRFDNGRFAQRLLRQQEDRLAPLAEHLAALPGFDELSPLRRAQWIEQHTLLHGYLLSSQGDRMSFAHGVEGRCPFLSPPLVEHLAGLPEELLLPPNDDEKHLLKAAFRDVLPARIAARPKQPYRAPGSAAFRSPADPHRLLPWVEDLLAPTPLADVAPLDGEHAGRFLDKLRATPADGVSPRDDQAFVLLLSLVLLDRQLVRGLDRPTAHTCPPITHRVDLGRSSSEDASRAGERR